MSVLVLTFLLLAGSITTNVLGQDLVCDSDFDFASRAYGSRFTTSVGGRTYDCTCLGSDCEQTTCILLRRQDTEERQDEPCTDKQTGRLYARGTTFVRRKNDGSKLLCTCPDRGNLKIKCRLPQCVIPPPPPPTRAHLRLTNGSCFDKHNDQWYAHYTPYIRRVVMSYAPDIVGEYRCTCTPISTSCAAMEIPCCDTNQGRFVAKNERFVTQLGGLRPMNCMCLGGRGRVGSCEEMDDRREIGQSRRRQRDRCLDTETKRYYREGSTFVQIKRSGERECTCNRIKNRMKISCKRRS